MRRVLIAASLVASLGLPGLLAAQLPPVGERGEMIFESADTDVTGKQEIGDGLPSGG